MSQGRLPMDVIREIVARVPAKAIGQCRCVCKSWYSLTVDPFFVRKQLIINHHHNIQEAVAYKLSSTSSFSSDMIQLDVRNCEFYVWKMMIGGGSGLSWEDPTPPPKKLNFQADLTLSKARFKLIGSSNGLLCLSSLTNRLLLWNPCINKYKIIPLPQSRPEQFKQDWRLNDVLGFGFVPQTGDYKIIMLQMNQNRQGWPNAEIYSLCTNTWKRISSWDDDCGGNRKSCSYYLYRKMGVTHNFKGNRHWIARKVSNNGGVQLVVMAFDIVKDRFHEIPFPAADGRKPKIIHQTVTDYQETCALILHISGGPTEVWVLKDYTSWTKLYSLCHDFGLPEDITKTTKGLTIICDIMDNGQLVIEPHQSPMVLYEPATGNHRKLELYSASCPMVCYKESIALLDEEEEDLFRSWPIYLGQSM